MVNLVSCNRPETVSVPQATLDNDRYEFIVCNKYNQVLLDKKTGRVWRCSIKENSYIEGGGAEITPKELRGSTK